MLVKVISTGYPDSNTMVVDGGNWDNSNQSEVWSVNNNGDWDTTNTVSNMFDGDLSTQSYSVAPGGGGGTKEGTVTFSGLIANNKVRAYFYTGSLDLGIWEINDVNISAFTS